MQRARLFAGVVSALGFLFAARGAAAQTGALQYQTVAYAHDTGLVSNTSDQRATVISFQVLVSGAEWLRLYFDTIELGPAVLRVTSYKDGDVQELHARHCVEWQNSTCYFNGNAVQVEVEAPAHSGPYRLSLRRADVGELYVAPESLCGPNDDRVLSNDPRVGLIAPIGCTTWLIADANRGLLTAGHCIIAGFTTATVWFNTPLSDPSGSPQMPSANDQYPIDPPSIQVAPSCPANCVIGNDWAYFGTLENPNTNLSAGHAQGCCLILANPPTGAGHSVRITGHGDDSTPLSYRLVQQTHSGPLVGNSGSTLSYDVDTEGGNSGSPIVDVTTGNAIGIHTCGGCAGEPNACVPNHNSGTATTNQGLRTALSTPMGVCRAPKLLASDGAPLGHFGVCVFMSGDTAVVGANGDDDNGADSGSAYVFVRSGSTWTQQAKLLPSDGAAGDSFGVAVAISGDTAVVGAHGNDDNGPTSGSAYVFVRNGLSWTQQAKLLPSDGASFDSFGLSVSINANTAIVGAPDADYIIPDQGAAYVFTRNGVTWSQQSKLVPSDLGGSKSFGNSAAISGDTAIVGAYHDSNNFGGGSAYVFVRNGLAWSQQSKLLPGDGAAFDRFGSSVALSDETAVVGASHHDHTATDSGAAYVFERSGAAWSQQSELLASDGAANDYFGFGVAVSGDAAVVGAYLDDDNGSASGSAYAFVRTGINWTQRSKLLPHDGSSDDDYGVCVAASGDTAFVGAFLDDDNGLNSGSAYAFALPWQLALIYCTAKINSQGCLPAIRFSGTPSLTVASPFNLVATSVINNKSGRYFYSKVGQNNVPFQGGTLCVQQPLKRSPLQNSGGHAGADDCSGVMAFDFNAWLDGGNDTSVTVGTKVYIQGWYRDSSSPSTTGLTNAVEFEVLP